MKTAVESGPEPGWVRPLTLVLDSYWLSDVASVAGSGLLPDVALGLLLVG